MKKSTPYPSESVQNQSAFHIAVERLTEKLPVDFPIIRTEYHHAYYGSSLYQHIHDCLEIGYCRSGAGIFLVGNKIMPFSAGDVVVISEREMHGIRNGPGEESDWEFLFLTPASLVGVDREVPEFLSTACLAGHEFHNVRHAETDGHIHHLILALMGELRETPRGFRSAVRALAWALMIALQRKAAPQAVPQPADAMAHIAPALNYLAQHYAEPVRMETLLELCHTSDSTLRRLFRRVVNTSPQNYLARLRIQMATALLQNTEHSVLEIALMVGYPTLSSFHRQFTRQVGMSPGQVRKRRG